MKGSALPERGARPARLALAAGILALALAAALLPAGSASGDDALAAWRTLPGSDAGRQLLALARATVDSGPADSMADPGLPPPPAALYVTLVGPGGTRACVGEDPPRGADLAEAVASLAAQVRTGDRRRPPVRADELDRLRLVIAFAGPAEPVTNPAEVDPGREGLLIEGARGRVAFLPGEARTVSWALREARRIGVLEGPVANARCSRFQVVTLHEPAPAAAAREDADAAR